MASTTEKVVVEIGAEDNASKVLDKVADNTKKFGDAAEESGNKASSGLAKFAGGLKTLAPYALAGGAAVVAGLTLAVNAARGAEEQMARVDATLKTMGKTGMAAKESILKVADSMVKLGFDDEDTAESMAKLYQRTNDLTQAQKLTALAADLARAKNIELSDATNLVGQVLSGNGKVLKQYGIDINEAASPLEALSDLQKSVAGQSEAYANTFNGQIARLQVTWGNFLEEVGTPLLGILTQLLTKFLDWIDSIGGAEAIIGRFKEAVQFVLPVLEAMWTTVQFLAWFVTQAVTDMYTIWSNNMYGIQTIVTTVWNIVSTIVMAVLNSLKAHFKLFTSVITGDWQGAWDALLEIASIGGELLMKAWNGFLQGVGAVATSVWEGVKNTFKDGINWIIDKMNAFINSLSSVTGAVGKAIGQKGWSIPTIPKLAEGGIVTRPTLAMIGEAGAEAVVPLSKAGRGTAGALGGITVVLSNNNFYGDDKTFAEKIGNMIVENLTQHTAFSKY